MTVLLKTEANANKMSLSFPNSILPPKNPDNIRNFVQELPDSFTTDEAIQIGAKYDFNHRKVTRLLKSLNGVKINKISHGSYTKMNEQ